MTNMVRPAMLACAAWILCTTWICAAPAFADEYIEYPSDSICYPFQRSTLTGRAVAIAPYRRVFPVRVYSTPPQQPYYNVPPYAVIAPY